MVDLIHSVVKMAVEDHHDGSISGLAATSRRRRSESGGCTDDEDTPSAAAVVEQAAQEAPPPKSGYFNELFPRLDLDGEAWLRAWPKFTTRARQQLCCHDDVGRATYDQYEFNLKMYEWDAWSGNYRNKDLRRQVVHK